MADFFSTPIHPKARKEHQCDTCFRTIDVGEVYHRQFTVWYGRGHTWKMCLHCEAMIPYLDYDEGYNNDDFVNWEPRNLKELRVRVHLNKKWRNNAGELYPIPFQKDSIA